MKQTESEARDAAISTAMGKYSIANGDYCSDEAEDAINFTGSLIWNAAAEHFKSEWVPITDEDSLPKEKGTYIVKYFAGPGIYPQSFDESRWEGVEAYFSIPIPDYQPQEQQGE